MFYFCLTELIADVDLKFKIHLHLKSQDAYFMHSAIIKSWDFHPSFFCICFIQLCMDHHKDTTMPAYIFKSLTNKSINLKIGQKPN